jgi:hypothetical protein
MNTVGYSNVDERVDVGVTAKFCKWTYQFVTELMNTIGCSNVDERVDVGVYGEVL